jgi:hypothetical protein
VCNGNSLCLTNVKTNLRKRNSPSLQVIRVSLLSLQWWTGNITAAHVWVPSRIRFHASHFVLSPRVKLTWSHKRPGYNICNFKLISQDLLHRYAVDSYFTNFLVIWPENSTTPMMESPLMGHITSLCYQPHIRTHVFHRAESFPVQLQSSMPSSATNFILLRSTLHEAKRPLTPNWLFDTMGAVKRTGAGQASDPIEGRLLTYKNWNVYKKDMQQIRI